ncbi:hypothetical protein E3N88_44638 [Mikania micrantha]|uniref:PWWP domain-containing protein n=1 Tax=Mikania micrantha TaxID=192012 RepID=A0A5N6LDT8_9ASTR|nr:hypothetical protein E3N88_44638 [Mikania micrantha]
MAVEVKVYCRKKKTDKTKQIDHIPKWFQLPRSASVSKPRTEFYLPICSFKELDLRRRKEIQSSVIVGGSDMSNDIIRDTADPFSALSSGPQVRRQKTLANGKQLPLADVKLFGQRSHFHPCSNSEYRDDALEDTPSSSQLTENRETCTTPGSVVWAKTDGSFWWPAEILGERSNQGPLVLVQHFGRQGSVWVDPTVDLSPLEECFEERRCNQAKEFQNALKQALLYKEYHRRFNDLSGSPERDNSSSSGRARSKRERKPKVHFDVS